MTDTSTPPAAMPAEERDYEQELANIHGALAESVRAMTDEEIEQEIRDEGDDPDEVAEHVRAILREAVNKMARPTMDWQQVALNGGPPCFHLEDGHYCGRAERWAGHGSQTHHVFVSLGSLITAAETEARRDEREQCARIADAMYAEPGWCGDYKNAAMTIATAIRANTKVQS